MFVTKNCDKCGALIARGRLGYEVELKAGCDTYDLCDSHMEEIQGSILKWIKPKKEEVPK